MFVTLLGQTRLESIALPEEPSGRYFISGVDEKGRTRPALVFEPGDGRWLARETKRSRFEGNAASSGSSSSLELIAGESSSHPLRVQDERGSMSTAVLLVEPTTVDRIAYSRYLVSGDTVLRIGRGEDCSIRYDREFVSGSHAELAYRAGAWHVRDMRSSNGTYVNDVRVASGTHVALKPGDVVFVVGLRLIVGRGFISMNNPDQRVRVKSGALSRPVPREVPALPEPEEWEVDDEEQGAFFRSPRFRKAIQTRTFDIDAPPEPQQESGMALMQTMGPALVMGAAALFAGVIMAINTLSAGGSIFMALPMLVMSVSMIVSMALFPLIASRSQKKKLREDEARRQSRYMSYLNDTWAAISEERARQSQRLLKNHVSAEVCVSRALKADRKLWERSIDHVDFLELRLGLGSRPLDAEINYPEPHFSLLDDNLRDSLYEMVNAPTDLENVPITVSLIENRACGIIGERTGVLGLMSALLAQIVALHSYDEVKLVVIADEDERGFWDYLRLVPHVWSDDRSQRYFACGLKEAQELSIVLEKEMARRAEGGELEAVRDPDVLEAPHYVVIAASKRIADRCGFVATLLEGGLAGCFSLLALYDTLGNLPKECSIVINVEGGSARTFNRDDELSRGSKCRLDAPVSASRSREMAVALANTFLDTVANRYEMPAALTFMQMYGVGMVEHLDILTRWRENDPTLSLSVPVGVDENGDAFKLDLHEKSHGPHGLVAGMTGSGKSEFIITLILSLAINFSPDEIAFVLIDYKGGGLANAFDNERMRLPHLAGTITNLDGAAISRSLASIEAELKRRQVVFNEARALANEGTMDIYKYQQLHRRGVVDEPVPHLLIISDEFAELKAQQSEFMDQLVSTARIGRSLGVHLILATQKPNGVVSDQIWSNATFKVCLKVQDRADSLDMIHRPEAAELSQTGRFYLLVGFNELFAVGQSAWCGAPYYPSARGAAEKDDSISVIDDLGNVLRETRCQRDADAADGKQIISIIEQISESAKLTGAAAAPLWLDPIPEVIFVDDIVLKYGWRPRRHGVVEAVVGEYDDPARQRQGLLDVRFSEMGNLVVYGASGSGKSLLVSSLMYSLITSYPPSELNLYAIDLGTESLRAFDGAPHVGDVALSADNEKVVNLFRMLDREIARRRKLFADYGGDYLASVRALGERGDNASAVVVVIEGMAAFFELFGDLRDDLLRLTRDSARYGVYFVVTAESTSALGFRLAQNFGQSLALRLNDPTEYGSALNAPRAVLLSGSHGAGVAKLHEVLQFQTAHPLPQEGRSDAEAIREFCARTFCGYTGVSARPIPTLPERVTPSVLANIDLADDLIPCGIDAATLEPIGLAAGSEPLLIAASDDPDYLRAFAVGLAAYFAGKLGGRLAVLDAAGFCSREGEGDGRLAGRLEAEGRNADGGSAGPIGSIGDPLLVNGVEAVARFLLDRALDGSSSGSAPQLCLLFGLAQLMGSADFEEKVALEGFFSDLSAAPPFLVVDDGQALGSLRFDPWFTPHITANGIWIGSGLTDQGVVKLAGFSSDLMRPVPEGFGYVVRRGRARLAKMLQADAAIGEGREGAQNGF